MVTYRVEAWDAIGLLIKDFKVDVDEVDGANFILQQVLHIEGVVCARVTDLNAELVDKRCDPGVEFEDVVQ
jgi:hypothetical protein